MRKYIFLIMLLFTSIITLHAQQSVSKIVANYDTFVWPTSTSTFDVVSNDTYAGAAPGTGFVFTGTTPNATITPEGTWPSGITLSSSGIVTVTSPGDYAPGQLSYKICDNEGNCTIGSIIFNEFDPGTLAIDNNGPATVCSGKEVKIVNIDIAPTPSIGLVIGSLIATYVHYTFQVSKDNGTTWIDSSPETLNGTNSFTLSTESGTLLVRRRAVATWVTRPDVILYTYTNPIKLNFIKNRITFNGDNSFFISKGSSITIPTINTAYPSSVKIYDSNGLEVSQGSSHTFNDAGDYVFTVVATNSQPDTICPEYANISVYVYEGTDCQKITKKIYASSQKGPDWDLAEITIDNPENALDADLSNGSTLHMGLNLLGLGTTHQRLFFTEKIDKGTPITVKFGMSYSLLQLGGGFTICAIDEFGNNLTPLKSLNEGGLLNLLQGNNAYEYTYIPTKANGETVDYYGVRVVLGSTLALASTGKVYGAYYTKTIPNPNLGSCVSPESIKIKPRGQNTTNPADDDTNTSNTPNEVTLNSTTDDVLWGVKAIASVATVASSIYDPYLAIDNDIATGATMIRAVNVLDEASLTVKFRQIAKPGDQIRIILSKGNSNSSFPNILSLSLLSDLKIQRYLGDKKVGEELDNTKFKLINLDLFSIFTAGSYRNAVIISGISEPFDRVKISVRNVVNVGLLEQAYWKFYDVATVPAIAFEGQADPNETTTICAGKFLQVLRNNLCTEYNLSLAYAEKDANNVVTSYTEINNSILRKIGESTSRIFYSFNRLYPEHDNNLYLKIIPIINGCPYGDPQYLKINLKNCDNTIVNPVIKTNNLEVTSF